MNSVYKIKNIEAPITDVDLPGRSLVQRYTTYDVLDADGDLGRKGMFNKTWDENKARIKHLQNHDTTKPLGLPVKLWEDNTGALFQSKIGTHALGDDFIKMADSGLITEASYGYKTVKEQKSAEGNNLLEVKLWEVSSLTHWGANQYTSIVALTKSLTKQEEADKIGKRIKSLESFCKNSTATDETIQLLLLEMKQLHQLFIDITTPAAIEALEPKEDNELLLSLTKFNKNFN